MSWNYRMMATEYDNGEIEMGIHEVYYDGADQPEKYSDKAVAVVGSSHKDVFEVLKMMTQGALSPVLWAGERFPEEYKI